MLYRNSKLTISFYINNIKFQSFMLHAFVTHSSQKWFHCFWYQDFSSSFQLRKKIQLFIEIESLRLITLLMKLLLVRREFSSFDQSFIGQFVHYSIDIFDFTRGDRKQCRPIV